MATNNRYTPHFKAYAVGEYKNYRTKNPDETQASAIRAVSVRLDVPESTMGAWIRADMADPSSLVTGSNAAPVPTKAAPKRVRVLDVLLLVVAIFAAAPAWLGIQPFRDTQEQTRNAESYFKAVTAPNPPSYSALVTRYDAALTYTEDGSPAARLLALESEVARVMRNSQATIAKTQGSELTAETGGFRACTPGNPADCQRFHALEFDERHRLRSFSVDDLRIQSALLSREEASNQNDDVKVTLIDGFENKGQVIFAAEVENQRNGEVATLDFSGARYAAGTEQFSADIAGPSTLGPKESVTIVGVVKHGRGVTLSVPLAFRSTAGNGPERSTALLLKLN